MNQGLDTTGDTYRRQQFFHQLFCDQAERVPESHRQTHHGIRSLLKLYQRRSPDNRYRRSWLLFSQAVVSGYSAAPLPSSPFLNTLNISVAMLFSRSLSFFTHRKPGFPFPPRPSQDVGLSSRTLGTFSPVSLPPSPGPPSPGGSSVVRTRSGTAPRHLRDLTVLSRMHIGAFISCRAPAPRPGGEGAPLWPFCPEPGPALGPGAAPLLILPLPPTRRRRVAARPVGCPPRLGASPRLPRGPRPALLS